MKRTRMVSLIFAVIASSTFFLWSCGGGGGSSSGSASPNVAFLTSVKGPGDLGSWADAGGNTGLAAADAICQSRASAAGLSGTFVAWLSDSTDDAYCRVQGLSGTKSGNCGQALLPNNAGPWVRTDGFPFGATLDLMLNDGVIYSPMRYDEFGSPIPAGTIYFTATSSDGTLNTARTTCDDWTNSYTGFAVWVGGGNSEQTTYNWTRFGAGQCQVDQSLLCMEVGSGGALPSYASSGKKVFVTSLQGFGDLGIWPEAGSSTGIAAGDAICQSLATDAGLPIPANYKAWLSDTVTNAASRLTSNGPWVRIDGVRVADDLADLIDGNLFSSINVDENGNYTNRVVWTGTSPAGLKAPDTCGNWLNSSANGEYGSNINADSEWTESSQLNCTSSLKLYCFED